MNILVSINCITYNHEKYIAEALDSFLVQKTNFDFEIVIGEDCSTDNTRSIIQSYVDKYPEKIVLVTSEQNVGWMKNSIRIHEKSRGKYIAVCEGDDYWINPCKLQKQIDYMENNPECTLCFHNSYKISNNDSSKRKLFLNRKVKNRKYNAGELSTLFIPTASRIYSKYTMDNPPEWYETSVVGDLPSQLIQTNHGYAYYMSEPMSVYRVDIGTSATAMLFGKENFKEKLINNHNGVIKILENFDEYTEYIYTDYINMRKESCIIEIALINKDMKKIKNSPKYKSMNSLQKLELYLRGYFPKLYSIEVMLKEKVKRTIKSN